MTAPSLNQSKVSARQDAQWVLDDLWQSELMLMGLYLDSTEEELLGIYAQYPLDLLHDLLEQLTRQKQYICCDAIRQVIGERSASAAMLLTTRQFN